MSGGTLILLLCLIVLGICAIRTGTKDIKEVQKHATSGETTVEYLGGSPHIDVASSGYIKPRENGLAFTGSRTHLTKWTNIKSVEVKNHEQITSDITAGRVLLLGVFALAAKKQTVHRIEYLVIHCEEEGVNYDMVFSGTSMGTLASKINRVLISYRKNQCSLNQPVEGI